MITKDYYELHSLPQPPQIWIPQRSLEKIWPTREKRAIYITAPAGYGKTTAACARLRENPSSGVYVKFETHDNIPHRFFNRIIYAMGKILTPDDPLPAMPENGTSAGYANLLAELFWGRGPVTIALDDFHVINNGEIINTLPFLIEELPEVCFVILSRFRPHPCFGPVSRNGHLLVADSECLRLSLEEFNRLLDGNGVYLPSHVTRSLYEATEGWPLCVRALLLAKGSPVHMGDILGKYIEAVYWEIWDGELREFLVDTAVTDLLCPELCAALSGRADSGAILERLYNENVYIDRTAPGEYRYHAFFREYLLSLLKNTEKESTLHRRAAAWFYACGEYLRASDHYLKSGEISGAARSVESLLRKPGHAVDELAATLDELPLFSLPSKTIADNECLAAAAAYACYLNGRAERQLVYSDMLSCVHQESGLSRFLVLVDPRKNLVECAGTAAICADAGGSVPLPSVTQGLPFAHRSFRDFSELAVLDEDAMERVRMIFPVVAGDEGGALESAVLAGICFEKGDYAGASAHLSVISVACDTVDLSPEIRLCAAMIRSEINRAENRMEEAARLLDEAEETLTELGEAFLAENIRALKTRWRLRLGDRQAAAEWLDSHFIAPLDGTTLFENYLDFTAARALFLLGEKNAALLLLSKLRNQAALYGREMDLIESDILTAAVYDQDGNQEQALEAIAGAVCRAQKYGFTEPFVSQAQDICLILNELSFRIMRYNFTDQVDADFLRLLCVACGKKLGRAKVRRLAEKRPAVRLAKTQAAVAELLVKGRSYQEIADEMELKLSTVKSYIRELYNKLGVFSTEEAIDKLYEIGIFQE